MYQRIAYALILASPLVVFADLCESAPTQVRNMGDVAQRIACEFPDINSFILAVAYLSGIGFGVAAIFKFKQVKDNPTQIPISTPFALLGVSTMLVFLPGIIKPAGETFFGGAGIEDSDTAGMSGEGGGQLMPFDSSS